MELLHLSPFVHGAYVMLVGDESVSMPCLTSLWSLCDGRGGSYLLFSLGLISSGQGIEGKGGGEYQC